jgi:hypothetical protein
MGVIELARWWTSATKEARWQLLRMSIDQRSPQKGTPPLAELKLAIILAEAEAGEIDPAST